MTQAALDRGPDPTTVYAVDVVDGAIVTGRPVLWACQRHLEDLEHGDDRGLWFDPTAADRVFRFFSLLRHFEGELAGQPLELEPWQRFVLGSVFGWRRGDGTRRFREAWMEVARKNGKSFLAAGVGNFLLVADGEAGAQIYTAATKREQARIIHRAAVAQRDKSPEIRKRVDRLRDRLVVKETRSFFAPLGQDSKTEDGLNPHGAILDEIHAHKDGGMWDVLESAMGARRQPLIFATTTAGSDVGSFGKQQHDYYMAVLDPESGVQNDSVFAYVAQLDLAEAEGAEGDDPYDEGVWAKANPNLGVSVSIDYLQQRAKKAQQHNRFEADFFVKNLDVWIQSETRWLSSAQWDACRAGLADEELRSRPCFGGVDLSTTTDVTAYVLYFPPTKAHPRPAVKPFFWVPEDTVPLRAHRDRVDYSSWIADGYIETTPGNMVDQAWVRRGIKDLRKVYRGVQKLAFDPKFAPALMTQLIDDGFDVVQFNQGFSTMCGPTLELERLLLAGDLEHDGNPVLRWMAGNVVLKHGAYGDVRPDKIRSPERIDGMVALIMAIGVAGVNPVKPAPKIEHHSLSKRRGTPKRKIYGVFR